MYCCCYFQGETSSKTVVEVTVDNTLSDSASMSSMKTNIAVKTVQGNVPKMSENVNTSKNLKTKSGDGSKGNTDVMMNCIKNCVYYEACIGEKEARFREIGQEMAKLSDERRKLDVEQMELCEKIQVLEAKSPELSLMEFQDLSFLKYLLNKKLKEKQDINRQISLLILERDRVTKAMHEAANLYKSFVYKQERLLCKDMNGKGKK